MDGVEIRPEAGVKMPHAHFSDLGFQFDQNFIQQGMGDLFVH